MKRNFYILCTLLAFLCFSGQAKALDYPEIHTLPNGLTVLIKEDPRFPLVSTRLYVKAGSSMEDEKVYGISHFLEHMVFKGSKSHPQGIDGLIEGSGGNLNAYTSYDQTVYYNDMPADKWKLSLEGIQGLVFDPLLRQSDLDKEREVVIAELRQRGDSQGTKLLHMTTKSAFRDTDYMHPVIGYLESIRATQAKDMQEYIDNYYNPQDMLLVVVGDIKADDVMDEVTKLFSSYTNKNTRSQLLPYSDIEIENLANGFQVNIEKGNWNKAYVQIAFPIPHKAHADNTALGMLGFLLNFNENSLLKQEFIVKEKLVDTISAGAMGLDRLGLFVISASLEEDKIEPFFAKLSSVLSTLKASDFSDKEIEQAKTSIENMYWRQGETIQSLADLYGDNYWEDPQDILGTKSLMALQNVNKKQIDDVIKRYIKPEAMSLSLLQSEQGTAESKKLKAIQEKNWPIKNDPKQTSLQSNEFEVLEIKDKVLVLIPDNTLPFVDINLLYQGGVSLLSSEEQKTKAGLANLTAEVITKATKAKNKKKLTDYLAQKDIGLAASASYLDFEIAVSGHSRFEKDMLELLSEVIRKPAFTKKDFNDSLDDEKANLAKTKDSATSMLMRELRPFLYPNHLYSSYLSGTNESLENITVKDLKEFWNIQKEQSLIISAVGTFNRQELIDFVEELPVYKEAQKPAPVLNPTWNTKQEFHATLEGRNQNVTLLLFPTVSSENQDAPALEVLNAALGGFNGLIYQELREKRNLGYSAFPLEWTGKYAGFFGFGIIAAPEHNAVIREQFMRITRYLDENGITQEDFDRAKASLQMSYVDSQQSLNVRASQASQALLNDKEVDYNKKYFEKMLAVDLEEVNAVIKKYLIPSKGYWLSAGEEEKNEIK